MTIQSVCGLHFEIPLLYTKKTELKKSRYHVLAVHVLVVYVVNVKHQSVQEFKSYIEM